MTDRAPRMQPPAPQSSGQPLLRVSRLAKSYGGTRTVEVLRNIDLHVARGEFVCLVGPSGAGKTTLLRCMSGLLAPSSGEVVLDGTPISGPPPAMAVVFQEYGRSLFPWLSVADNVALPLKAKGLARARRAELVRNALAVVSLSGTADAYPWQLSGGMQQRAAIARAIAYEPKILVMDEPFAAIDAQTRADLEDLVRDLWRKLGITVLFVTHDIDEAVYLGSRVIAISTAPTVVMDDVTIDLPLERSQLDTRSLPRFAELRRHVYAQVQLAKRGWRPPNESRQPRA